MPEVVAIEWVIAIAVGGLLVGLAAGWGVSLTGGRKTKVAELEQALEKAEEEMTSYRSEVYGQFAETAEKFRALDKSYNDLHRQLAQSSAALCGDAGAPLLSGPETVAALDQATPTETAEKEVDAQTVEVQAQSEDDNVDTASEETAADAPDAEAPVADTPVADKSAADAPEADAPEAIEEKEEIVVAEVADAAPSTPLNSSVDEPDQGIADTGADTPTGELESVDGESAPKEAAANDIPTLTETDAKRRESA